MSERTTDLTIIGYDGQISLESPLNLEKGLFELRIEAKEPDEEVTTVLMYRDEMRAFATQILEAADAPPLALPDKVVIPVELYGPLTLYRRHTGSIEITGASPIFLLYREEARVLRDALTTLLREDDDE